MFSWLFLLYVLPTWLVAMLMLQYLRRRQQQLEQNRVPLVAKTRRSDAE